MIKPSVFGGEEQDKHKPVIPGCSPGPPGPPGPRGPEVRPFFKILNIVGNLTLLAVPFSVRLNFRTSAKQCDQQAVAILRQEMEILLNKHGNETS